METFKLTLTVAVSAICLSANVAFAAPKTLITHNNTDHLSNATVNHTPSPYPTPSHQTRAVDWSLVKVACLFKNPCKADIYAETDTDHPILIGNVKMDLNSGEISPKQISNNGYTLDVNGIAETTISYTPSLK